MATHQPAGSSSIVNTPGWMTDGHPIYIGSLLSLSKHVGREVQLNFNNDNDIYFQLVQIITYHKYGSIIIVVVQIYKLEETV